MIIHVFGNASCDHPYIDCDVTPRFWELRRIDASTDGYSADDINFMPRIHVFI